MAHRSGPSSPEPTPTDGGNHEHGHIGSRRGAAAGSSAEVTAGVGARRTCSPRLWIRCRIASVSAVQAPRNAVREDREARAGAVPAHADRGQPAVRAPGRRHPHRGAPRRLLRRRTAHPGVHVAQRRAGVRPTVSASRGRSTEIEGVKCQGRSRGPDAARDREPRSRPLARRPARRSQRDEQLEQVLDSIRLLGQAGVPCLGYNFSLAGVWGHITGPFARGGAESIGFDARAPRRRSPRSRAARSGTWTSTPTGGDETIGAVGADELWSRLEAFLAAAVPVAEAAGVRLCAHPDDPPVPTLRNTARVLTSEGALQRLLDSVPSRANSLEFCQGTISEMPDVDVYDAIARFARQDRIGYVHFRNVVGRVPVLPRGVHRRGRRRHAARLADLRRERLRRRLHPRSHSADDVRRALARWNGVRARLHERGMHAATTRRRHQRTPPMGDRTSMSASSRSPTS